MGGHQPDPINHMNVAIKIIHLIPTTQVVLEPTLTSITTKATTNTSNTIQRTRVGAQNQIVKKVTCKHF
jgi:hypothetical protein